MEAIEEPMQISDKQVEIASPADVAFEFKYSISNSVINAITNGNNSNADNNGNNNHKVWTMKDLYKYQVSKNSNNSRNYTPELYNFAANNKPLCEGLDMEYRKFRENVVKEDGELEEGEIDLNSDVDLGLESRVEVIRKGFESVTIDDAEKSFEQVCSKVENLLDSVQECLFEQALKEHDDSLVQLSLTAIRTVNSVFCSMTQDQKEHNRGFLIRSFDHVTSRKSLPFSPKQLEEINVMISALDLSPVCSNNKKNDEKDSDGVEAVNRTNSRVVSVESNQDLTFSKKLDVSVIPVGFSEKIQPVSSGCRQSLPLLDLHKVHDIDSLPSPTREARPPLQFHKDYSLGHGSLKPEWPVPAVALPTDKVFARPYETDVARKAVSSYQQKFSRTSFFTSDELPSPTPSDDSSNSDNISDGDTSVEVASAPSARNAHPMPARNMEQLPVSTIPNLLVFPGQERTNTWRRSSRMPYGPVPALKSSTGKKTKDPRPRLDSDETTRVGYQDHIVPSVNTKPGVSPSVEMAISRKQRMMEEEPMLDGPVVKRQRIEIIGHPASKGSPAVRVIGDWLQDIATRALQIRESGIDSTRVEHSTTSVGSNFFAKNPVSMTVNQSYNLPPSDHIATTSLQSLLKDISVNPSLLTNLTKMEQQKSANSFNNSTQLPTMDALTGAIPVMTMAPPRPSVPGPIDVGLLQTPSQTVQLDESTKVYMKPRDPRRCLHGDSSQKRGGNASDQTNIKSSVLRQEDQSGSSPHHTPPNTSQQLIKSLKNINNTMSVSQATTSQEAASHIHSTQEILSHHSNSDKELVSDFGKISGIPASEDVVGQSRPQHIWSAVEHLFDGYNDKQKAAIQKERSRRMEEQRKLFATKKLCLVLDLDHTLLNSAKFGEVDPMHDEILRKKEEQDQGKPQRHLFRSPHMSMWTKLRPGIWNFLEKASKLFELHICTMGNKLYATEMAKLLDPKGELFAGRVISKGDDGDLSDGDERIAKTKDLDGVLGMESSVVIIDDSVKVWPHNKLNLIAVERYIYFPCSRRQFGLPGPSLLEIEHDERPEDGTLASSLAVIERIHQNFFTHQSLEEVDVRNILAAEQRKILAGCRIVFSRVFPVGEANPHLHPLWQTAEQFGAVCTTQIDEHVTHVVANSVGTDKVNWAISNGRYVVHPHWVEASAMLYRRANEHDFAIKSQ